MKYKKIILSFFIPFFILLLILLLTNGFNDYQLLVSDSLHQYYQFLFKFKNILDNGSSLLYAMDFGIGSDFFGIYLYYLLSPTNLLLKFVSYDNIYIFMVLMSIIKVSLCGVTMYLFLKYNFKENKYLLLFSTAYALSTTIINNYFQMMWLDSYVLAPLVILGIDKIINEDKPLFYGISLFLTILLNYYMGFITCVYCVIYFVYKLLIKKPDKKVIKTFIITSLLAGLMTMFTNIPGLLGLLSTNRKFGLNQSFNSPIDQIISSFFIGHDYEELFLNYTNPKLYVGILTFLCLLFYFFNNKTLKREKKITALFLILFMLFMMVPCLNSIWHGFSAPVGFNFRYAFLINIFIIYLGCIGFENREYVSKVNCLLSIYLFIIFCFCNIFDKTIMLKMAYISLALFLIYILIFRILKKDFKLLICLVFIGELFFNTYAFFKLSSPIADGKIINSEIKEIIDNIKKEENSEFYRVEFRNILSFFSFNDNLLYDYNSATTFTSLVSSNTISFLERIGYNCGYNYYTFKNYYITNSILGIKYYADKDSKDEIIDNYQYKMENYGIYKNENALNLGYIVSPSVKEKFNYEDITFSNQENILNKMVGSENKLFIEIPAEKISEYEYKFKKEANEKYYMSFAISHDDLVSLLLLINGEESTLFEQEGLNTIFSSAILPDEYANEEEIVIKLKETEGNITKTEFKVYTFNYDKYVEIINKLKQNQLEIIEFKDDYIKGTINGEGVLFTSIPYSENWKAYIDGVLVETYQIFDTFLGIDIDGEHTVEFKYEIDSFKYSFIVSGTAAILFILYIRKKNLDVKRKI